MAYTFNNISRLINSVKNSENAKILAPTYRSGAPMQIKASSDYALATQQKSIQNRNTFTFGFDKWGNTTKTVGE